MHEYLEVMMQQQLQQVGFFHKYFVCACLVSVCSSLFLALGTLDRVVALSRLTGKALVPIPCHTHVTRETVREPYPTRLHCTAAAQHWLVILYLHHWAGERVNA